MEKTVIYEMVTIKKDTNLAGGSINITGRLLDYAYSAEEQMYKRIRIDINFWEPIEITNIPKGFVEFFTKAVKCI